MSSLRTTKFVISDKPLSLKSSCFEVSPRNFESHIGNLGRICQYSLFSKHQFYILLASVSIYHCQIGSLTQTFGNVCRISVLVSLWDFFKDFTLSMVFSKFWTQFWTTKLNSPLYSSNLFLTLHQKCFPLRISSVNVTKSIGNSEITISR